MSARDVNLAEHTVTARKMRACEGHRCVRVIQPGEDYVRAVAFPGHDANGSDRPWVMRVCLGCYFEYDQAKPMPPRRTRRQSCP